MHGVVAAGSEPTAEAGAEILARGGNAIDAAVAACFATAAGEPTLTSLAGGGVLVHRDARDGSVSYCDFFSDAPRLGPSELPGLDFRAVDLDFGPTTQRFYIGAGAAAVPGVIPGLCTALERWGTLTLGEVVAPACRRLRAGVRLGPYQAHAAALLAPILTHTGAGRRIFQQGGRTMAAGDWFRLPQLADTLEALARRGWQKHYREVLGEAMLAQHGPASGGLLAPDDLDCYRVVLREPIRQVYRGVEVLTNPPPAAGGIMIALMLRLLAHEPVGRHAPGSTAHARLLACAMAVADEARADGEDATTAERFAHWQRRFRAALSQPTLPRSLTVAAPASTTHVSVIDAHGNAVGVTFSYGEGNGVVIGDSGIMMNNLMGEEDLHPDGFGRAAAGARLATMMAPTLLAHPDGAVTVLGTGGANRIRTAIVQVLSLVLDHGYAADAAVSAPRIHYEDGVLDAELLDGADAAPLAALGPARLVRFDTRNLFFGGVHLASRAADGTLSGAGDPRRGGCCRVL